jgi:uncharacterized protein
LSPTQARSSRCSTRAIAITHPSANCTRIAQTSGILPWAILPEVDYLVSSELGARAQETFLADIAEGSFVVEYGKQEDVVRAHAIGKKYRTLGLGLVDTVVMAIAERIRAEAIATLDLRHFSAVRIIGSPRLFPRDAR